MLFTGDAGMPTEERLLAAHDDLRADILKVGHHGSAGASSPQFLGAVNASLAVISVGRHNLFHHPALPTIAHLVAAHDIILRTDQCGGITLDMSALRVAPTLPCADIQKPPAESR
jgi:competence protein ComEC